MATKKPAAPSAVVSIETALLKRWKHVRHSHFVDLVCHAAGAVSRMPGVEYLSAVELGAKSIDYACQLADALDAHLEQAVSACVETPAAAETPAQ